MKIISSFFPRICPGRERETGKRKCPKTKKRDKHKGKRNGREMKR